MRYIILTVIMLTALAAGIYFSWTTLYYPAGPNGETTEEVDNQVESLSQEKNRQIIDSGMLFGSKEEFKKRKGDLKEISNPHEFLFSGNSPIYRAWLLRADSSRDNASFIAKAYWTDSSYYISRKNYYLYADGSISPSTLKQNYQTSDNAGWIALLSLGELIAAFIIFALISSPLDKNILIIFSQRANNYFPDSKVIPKRLQKRDGKVIIALPWEGEDDYRQRSTCVFYKNHCLGELSLASDAYLKFFQEFLNKFGKRMKLEDSIDRKMIIANFTRWKIDYLVLLSGYLLLKQDVSKFEETAAKAATPKEFLMASGISQ